MAKKHNEVGGPRRSIPPHTASPADVAANDGPGFTQEEITLTPDMAKLFYEERAKNRLINQGHVKRLAAAMARGEWQLTHQGLAFNREGKLLDGQHRCLACIKSGVSIRIMVTWNVPDEAMDVMDVGQMRKAHQQLQIDGVANAHHIQAWANVARRIVQKKNDPLTTAELRRYIDENGPAVEWALAMPRKGPLRLGYVMGLLVFAHPKGTVEIVELAEKVESGIGLQPNDPALAIRRLVLEGKVRKDVREVPLKILRCCVAAIKQEDTFNPAKVFGTETSVEFFLDKHPIGSVVRGAG